MNEVVRRSLVLALLLSCTACAKSHHHAPGPAPAPSERLRVKSAHPLLVSYETAHRQIEADVIELRRHHVYAMAIAFKGYYKILGFIRQPSTADRVAANQLLDDIVAQARIQLDCARELKSFGHQALAEDVLDRVNDTRRTLRRQLAFP